MQEVVILHAPGAIPGIPGESHGPGTFLVDYEARTIEEVPQDAQAAEAQPKDTAPPVAATEEGA